MSVIAIVRKSVGFTETLRAAQTYGVDVVREQATRALDEVLGKVDEYEGGVVLRIEAEVEQVTEGVPA